MMTDAQLKARDAERDIGVVSGGQEPRFSGFLNTVLDCEC